MAKLIKTYSKTDIGVSINRSNGQPIDSTELWYDLDELKAYAKTDQAYIGQKVTYIDTTNKKIYHYRITWDGDIEAYTSGSGANGTTVITVDGTTVTLSEDNVLSVNVTDTVTEGSKQPITSGAVYETIGNINALLSKI